MRTHTCPENNNNSKREVICLTHPDRPAAATADAIRIAYPYYKGTPATEEIYPQKWQPKVARPEKNLFTEEITPEEAPVAIAVPSVSPAPNHITTHVDATYSLDFPNFSIREKIKYYVKAYRNNLIPKENLWIDGGDKSTHKYYFKLMHISDRNGEMNVSRFLGDAENLCTKPYIFRLNKASDIARFYICYELIVSMHVNAFCKRNNESKHFEIEKEMFKGLFNIDLENPCNDFTGLAFTEDELELIERQLYSQAVMGWLLSSYEERLPFFIRHLENILFS